MHEALLDRIRPVTQRLRRHRLAWFWAIIAIVASAVGAFLLRRVRLGELDGTTVASVLMMACLAAFLVAAIAVRLSYRNPRSVALRIEEAFPNLKQRLLTALSQSKPGQHPTELGYLQRRVIQEASQHSRSHRWVEAALPKHWLLGRLCSTLATVCLAAVVGLLIASTNDYKSTFASRIPPKPLRVIVEPGHTEIERGSSLVVSARFESHPGDESQSSAWVPEEGELRVHSGDDSQRVFSMSKSLDDPVIAGFIASVDQSFSYDIVTDRWQSELFRVEVFEFPSLVRSDAKLVYPEYTAMEDKTIEDTVRVTAVEGTKVTWLCHLNKSVPLAELVTKDGQRIAMTPDTSDPALYSAELLLEETIRMTLHLRDQDGRENKYPPELVARVLPNQPPKLKITSGGDVSVSPLEELPLTAEVQDDFGIKRAGVSFTFADQPTEEIELVQSVGRGAKQTLEYLVAFEDLKAEPDQLLAYHFWAEDHGKGGVVRRTEGDMFFAEVRPFEEIYREGEPPAGGPPSPPSENAQGAEELAELQKEIISATWNVLRADAANEKTDRFKEHVGLISESQSDAISLLDELAEKVEDEQSAKYVETARTQMNAAVEQLNRAIVEEDANALRDALSAEQSAYATLLKLRAREFQVTQQQRNQQQSSSSSSQQRRQQQLDDLELEQDENRYETQQQADQSEQAQQEREVRQVLNRLRELARRQADLNDQLAQLQSALEQADTREEKEEIERQLKRLRDQQQELLRETDELSERMQQPENQETMSEASEQLEQTRENVRQAGEALEKKDASEALAAGKRAEREFEEMRDEFRQQAAGQFNDDVRQMRSDAQQLDKKQEELAERLDNATQQEEQSPGLRRSDDRDSVEEAIAAQRQRLEDLLQRMQQTVQEAEAAEPLLAQQLYDSFRKTQQRQIGQRLEQTSELLQRGFEPQAREMERSANEGIDLLRQDIEKAATSVLGDETKSLARALSELNELQRALDEELRRNGQQGEPQGGQDPRENSGDPSPQGQEQDAQNGPNPSQQQTPSKEQTPSQQQGTPDEDAEQPESPPGSAGQRPGRSDQQEQTQRGSQPPQQGEGQPPGPGEPSGQPTSQGGQPNPQPQQGQPSGEGQQPGQSENQQGGSLGQFAADSPGGIASASPIAGDGFREWSDRLRDVEEMVEDPQLRSEAARIRDRAREMRIESRRHSKEPQWELVEALIAKPLRELKRDVQEELIRRSAEKNAVVPIDRDPVPDEYAGAVERYYESIGSGR